MVNLEVVGGNPAEVRERIIVAVAGEDEFLNYQDFGLTFESSEQNILTAIRPLIQEKFGVDLMGTGGAWLFKTRKAVTSRNIWVIPNSTAGATTPALEQLTNKERMDIFETLTKGCMHLWSKNKLQEDKMNAILQQFAELAEHDPLFLAHFTSYAFKKMDTKDLKVVACYINSLSDADGTPFVAGGEYRKPNFRMISAAAFQQLDPKLAVRVLELAQSKRKIGTKTVGKHFSKHLKTAAKKYLRYRESNLKILEGVQKAGLGKTLRTMYRIAEIAPSPEACQVLRWKQKKGFAGANVKIAKAMSFKGLTDLEIAQTIRDKRLKPQVIVGMLSDKISPVVAVALLEQCTGDQAVVYTSLFEDQGLMKVQEVRDVYDAKIRTAKNALDRVERIKQELDEDTKKVLRNAKADVRKEQVGDIGKVFMHLDLSPSMHQAVEIAKNSGAIIAECVNNPTENFHWAGFDSVPKTLAKVQKFTQEGFMKALYGVRPAGGGTNCLANFEQARKLGCDTDFYITDGGHNGGNIPAMIQLFKNRGVPMPRQVVIVRCGGYTQEFENGMRAAGLSVAVIDEKHLTESALVTQAIKTAAKGAVAVIDEIMEFPFLELPKWYESVG